MSYYTYPPTSASGSGVPIYPDIGSFPPGSTPGELGVAADTGILYEWDGAMWVAIAGPGSVLSVGTFDSGTPSADGAHIDGNDLIMQSASLTEPGLVNISTQTFAGDKTFNGMISAANLTGQNSGDVAVTFRPGGVQGGLVYDNWPDLYAAIVTLDIVFVTVTFDASLAPIIIPAGSYNLINVRFEAPLGTSINAPILITLADGCVFTNFPGVSTLITMESVSTTPVFIPPNAAYVLGLQFAGSLVSNTAAPMVQVPAGFTLFLILLQNSNVSGQPGFPLVELQGDATLFVLLSEGASFGDNVVSGGALATLQVLVQSSSANFGVTQTDFIGTTSTAYASLATNITFGNGLGDLVYADATGRGAILSADTTDIRKFLSELSIAGVPQAPVWAVISDTDMPAFTGDVTTTAGSTVTSLVATSNATLTSLSALTTATSLVSVGTITTGTWNATPVAINFGGTGQTTASAAFAALSPLTTAGDIIYEAAGPTPARLPIGTNTHVLTVSGGLPVWAAPATSGTVTSVDVSGGTTGLTTTGGPITSSGTITLTGTLGVANGGTGLTAGTSGGIPGYTGTTTIASSALLTADQLVVGGGAGATPKILAAGTVGQYLRMNSSPIPAWTTIPSTTVQRFTSGSGVYIPSFAFFVSSASATVGATYTNNGFTFTVSHTISSGLLLICVGTGSPTASGTLTKSAGTGDATITFSSAIQPVQLMIEQVGGGGGGGGGAGGAGGSNGTAGTASTFSIHSGAAFVTTNGGGRGGGGGVAGADPGGTVTIAAPAVTVMTIAGQRGSSACTVATGSFTTSGLGGGSGLSHGGGASGGSGAAGDAAPTNSGAGGAGGAAGSSSQNQGGTGGSGGGYAKYLIRSPLDASYDYSIGSFGTGGAAGGGTGGIGGDGGAGLILITEMYS